MPCSRRSTATRWPTSRPPGRIATPGWRPAVWSPPGNGPGAASRRGLALHLRESDAARRAQAVQRRQAWEAATGVSQRWEALKASARAREEAARAGAQAAPPWSPTVGVKVGLCLLVDFTDAPSTVPQAGVASYLNGDNYQGYGNAGSVKEYFQEVSNGKLTYTNVVTAYVRAPKPKSFYNDTSEDCGTNASRLITDVLGVLKASPNYTTQVLPLLNNLTVDGNNQVVACNVFYAGDNGGVWMYGLWPHSWSLPEGPQELSSGRQEDLQLPSDRYWRPAGHRHVLPRERPHALRFPRHLRLRLRFDWRGRVFLPDELGRVSSGARPGQRVSEAGRRLGHGHRHQLRLLPDGGGDRRAGHQFQCVLPVPETPACARSISWPRTASRPAGTRGSPERGSRYGTSTSWGDRDNQSLLPNLRHANYEVTLVQADNLWHFEHKRQRRRFARSLFSRQHRCRLQQPALRLHRPVGSLVGRVQLGPGPHPVQHAGVHDDLRGGRRRRSGHYAQAVKPPGHGGIHCHTAGRRQRQARR